MVDLSTVEAEINAIGEQIKSLKSAGAPSKEVLDAAIQSLLAAKRKYAENNNGIGVDGKPFEEPLNKSQQKAKAKAEKESSAGKQVRSSGWCMSTESYDPS